MSFIYLTLHYENNNILAKKSFLSIRIIMIKRISKKKTIRIISFILLLIPFVSCQNEKDEITYYDTYIEGYVKDNYTKEPISGIVFDANYYDGNSKEKLFVENLVKTDINGYYKVKIPKHGDINKGDNRLSFDFTSIELIPHNTENYTFREGEFSYKAYNLISQCVQINISPITFGYLKVSFNKNLYPRFESYLYKSSFEAPLYKPCLVDSSISNDKKTYYYKSYVGVNDITFYDLGKLHFIISNPRDTVVIIK